MTTSVSDLTYYKLNTVDSYGTKNTSKIISISSCHDSKENILIANDGSKEIGIIVNSSSNQKLELYIHNALGQLVEARNIEATLGYNNIRVDLQTLSNGLYYVSVYSVNEKMISKKIIVSSNN